MGESGQLAPAEMEPEPDPAECPAVTSQEELEPRDLSDFSLPPSFSMEDCQRKRRALCWLKKAKGGIFGGCVCELV